MHRVRSFWYGLTLPMGALRLIVSRPKLIVWSILALLNDRRAA